MQPPEEHSKHEVSVGRLNAIQLETSGIAIGERHGEDNGKREKDKVVGLLPLQ